MDFNTLRTYISSKLATLSGSGQPLTFVDDKHHTDFTGYPAATFEPIRLENEMFTNTDNKRVYSFSILVHQEMDIIGRDNAVRILDACVDAIKSAFDTDYTLGGNVDYTDPITVDFAEYSEGNASIKVAIMRLSGTIEEQVIT
jgi:hypothetical protein